MSNRIKFIEGSSLPHFERGGGGPMTKDEAVELMNRRTLVSVAKAAEGPLRDFADGSLFFAPGVSEAVTAAARKVMGAERPLGDDDAEYYAFCDYLYQQIARKIHYCLSDFIDGAF